MARLETATLGGGCFWCMEAVYQDMEGIVSVESGYMGGSLPNPSYGDVCTGKTGHVEVVRITFDADLTTYREILEVFFAIHDPTTRDRQGNDSGLQYRSTVFYHSEEQRATAAAIIGELEAQAAWPEPIVTELRPAAPFYKAEDYHQNYFRDNPQQPYCAFVVAPKLWKFRENFASRRKRTAAG